MYGTHDRSTITRHLLHLLHQILRRERIQSCRGLVTEEQRWIRQQLDRILLISFKVFTAVKAETGTYVAKRVSEDRGSKFFPNFSNCLNDYTMS